MGPRRAAEHLVRVNVPVLHALHPVDAPVVGAKGLVNVASFIVIIVHVRVKFPQAVSCWAGKEAFQDVPAHVVEVVGIVVEDGAAVIGMHHLAARFGAAVFVEQRPQSGRAGDGYDGLQVFTPLSCGFPGGRSFVGFPIDSDMPVAPILRAKPFNGGMDSLPFTIAPIVETTGALFSSEDGNLSQSIAMGYEIVIDEFAAPGADHVGWAGLASGRAVVKIGADNGDNGDLFTCLGVGWKPV